MVCSLVVVAACASAPEAPPAPPPPPPVTYALEDVTQLVPLDAVDELSLSAELARSIQEARSHVPSRVTSEQRAALDDLESVKEREEAALEGAEQEQERGRVLGSYYWERLRIFTPSLAKEPPDELLAAFERATGRHE